MSASHSLSPESNHASASSPEAPSPRSRGPRWGLLVLPVVAIGGGFAAWRALHHENAAEAPAATVVADPHGVTLTADAPQWRYVQLEVSAAGAALAPLPAPGRVTFDERRSSAIGTPLSGRVERVLIRPGDRVKKGDRLFSVRSAALADMAREEDGSVAEVSAKKRIVERTRELVAVDAAPEKELLAAEAELKQAELALKAAQAKRLSTRVAPDGDNMFWVTAPQSGTVVDLDVLADQEVTPDRAEPLLRLSDLDEVLVLVDVQESDAHDLKEGGVANLRVPGAEGEGLPGTVEHVSEVVDPVRHAVEVRIRVPNQKHALRPNAFVEADFAGDASSRRVRVPSEAVVTDGSRSVVYVARDGGRLEQARVTPGRQRDGEVEVLEGLAPGTRYVARGALLLQNQVELAQ